MRCKSLVICILFTFLLSTGVYAESIRSEVDSVVFLVTGSAEIGTICSNANKSVNKDILVYTGNDGLLSFSNKLYAELDVMDQRKFMETSLLMTRDYGLSPQIKNKMYNFIENQDSTASASVKYLKSDAGSDFASAASILKPFAGTVGVVLGLLTIFIFGMLSISMVLDMAYIVIPMVRILGDKDDGKRPKWVSREAFHAVKTAEGNTSYKGVMGIYIKVKLPLIMGMSLCLAYLISGQIYDIIVFFVDSFS